MSDILLKLSELHQQATVERSHYYVGRVVTEAAAEIKRLRETLQIAYGHMMNANIDLETGRTKATAVKTLKEGLAIVDAALKSAARSEAKQAEGG